MRKTLLIAISILLIALASCSNNSDPGFKGDASEVVQNLKPADVVKDVLSKDGKGVSIEYRLIGVDFKAVSDGSYILRATVAFSNYAVPGSSYRITGGVLVYDFAGEVTNGTFKATGTCEITTKEKLKVETDDGVAEVTITDDSATASTITVDVSDTEAGGIVEDVMIPNVTLDTDNATVTVGNETVDSIPSPTPDEPDEEDKPIAISTEEELRIAAASGSGEYYLTKDFALPTQLDIKAAITLDGRGYTISRTTPVPTEGSEEDWGTKAVILVAADGTKLSNLKVSGKGTPSTEWNPGEFGIKVWDAENVSLEDITVTNLNAGIQVNSSTVTISGTITVSGNEYGGIGVDQGSTLTTPGKLILANGVEIACTDTDVPAIWLESEEKGEISGDLEGLISFRPVKNPSQIYYITEDHVEDPVYAPALVMNETTNTGYKTLNDAVTGATSGDKITLLADVQLAEKAIISNKSITLDLAGYAISVDPTGFVPANTGLICVYQNGELTLEDTSAEGTGTIDVTAESANLDPEAGSGNYAATVGIMVNPEVEGATAKVTVNGGTIRAPYYGISGNGSKRGESVPKTTITLNKATIISTEGTGIYHPQDGTLTISDGVSITGYTTAVEIRGGSADISGGTFTAEKAPSNVTGNGNGPTSEGAAFAVAQHTTKLPVNVNISGGTFNGFSAVYQSNPQGNSDEDIAKINISITNGTFNATNEGTKVVYSDNFEDFIRGGTFSIQPDEKYIAEGYSAQQSGTAWIVAPQV